MHLHFDRRQGRIWTLSNGARVDDEIAELVIRRPDIAPIGNALFNNVRSQAYRFIDD